MDIITFIALGIVSYGFTAGLWSLFLHQVLQRWDKKIESVIPRIPVKVKYLGGPYDGHMDLVEEDKKKPFFITPYFPKDAESEPELIGVTPFGAPVYKPSLAYYREVTDEEYFYVRDISHEEYNFLVETGQAPAVEADSTSA